VLRTERQSAVLSTRVPECQKIRRVRQTSMTLNALVDSFFSAIRKSAGLKGLNFMLMESFCNVREIWQKNINCIMK